MILWGRHAVADCCDKLSDAMGSAIAAVKIFVALNDCPGSPLTAG